MRWICLVFAVITIVSFTQDLDMSQFASLRVIPGITAQPFLPCYSFCLQLAYYSEC